MNLPTPVEERVKEYFDSTLLLILGGQRFFKRSVQ
jgi:hypothetical protein